MERDLTEMIETTVETTTVVKQTASDLRNLSTQLFLESAFRPLKTFLNGTWFEHPLHPVLTDVPIGAWTMAMLLDVLGWLGVEGLDEASGLATGAGTAAAVGAAVTGVMDFTDTDPPEQSVAMTHGIINLVSTFLFAISFLWRWRSGWKARGGPFVLSSLGYLLVTTGAYLGGSLVFRQGVMVNRNAYRRGPKDFTPVLAVEELAPNHLKRVEAKGQPILLVKQGDEIYAIGAVCSHYGAPLDQGKLVEGGCVECPWHYSRYRLADGSYVQGPTTSPVPSYETRIHDGKIEVRARK